MATEPPTVLTSDMHGINKANFGILHWFGEDFRPRFTNLKRELKHIYGGKDVAHYENFWIKPVKQIKKKLIIDEQANTNKIIKVLALKETTQSSLIQKLCALPGKHKTRKAVFEFDKLIRSIYTLKCLLDPSIQNNVHRSQNRVESYHNLRAAIACAGGGKELLGRTDLEIEVSNKSNCLLASAVIYYNMAIHSHLKDTHPRQKKILKKLKKDSPVGWQHVHFTGHFAFYGHKNKISITEIVEDIDID